MGETPTEATRHGASEAKFVVLRGELGDVDNLRVERCDLIERLVLGLVFFLVLHDLCL